MAERQMECVGVEVRACDEPQAGPGRYCGYHDMVDCSCKAAQSGLQSLPPQPSGPWWDLQWRRRAYATADEVLALITRESRTPGRDALAYTISAMMALPQWLETTAAPPTPHEEEIAKRVANAQRATHLKAEERLRGEMERLYGGPGTSVYKRHEDDQVRD